MSDPLLEPVVQMDDVSGPVTLVRAAGRLSLRGRAALNGWCELTGLWDGRGLQGTFVATCDEDIARAVGAGDLVAEAVEVTDGELGSARFAIAPGTTFEVQSTLWDEELKVTFRPGTPEVHFAQPRDFTRHVTAHLLNVPPYAGAPTRVHTGSGFMRTFQRLDLTAGPWRVSIDGLWAWAFDRAANSDKPDVRAAVKPFTDLQRGGGHLITHTLRLERGNGASFGPKQARSVLDRMGLVLSFAFANPARPLYTYGFASPGQVSWAVLDVAPPLFPARGKAGARGWLPRRDDAGAGSAEALSAGLSRMLDRWLTDSAAQDATVLRESITRAVDWYVAAVGAFGRKECIVLAQASLEVLAMYYLTQHLRLSDRGQEGLTVADQLSVVLASLRIPSDIPTGWKELAGRKSDGPRSGPEVVTAARNAAVHPRGRGAQPPPSQASEEQTLALWYIEMILLRLLDYQGVYWDRLERANRSLGA
ncbi:hypothetical protein FHG89_19835 [Micromonospora orduensis]|uniref:YopA central domain-containing protein n=1 Tax=Micromonospora orduensis TaxID=1420891 RepID=A0A5C4QMR4_9ACTN|nr:hypothetical protein [Micromonospora orduensis]TNH26838.1 hypothetical protein FHG89_19835 [Micromonospora orduensis]